MPLIHSRYNRLKKLKVEFNPPQLQLEVGNIQYPLHAVHKYFQLSRELSETSEILTCHHIYNFGNKEEGSVTYR